MLDITRAAELLAPSSHLHLQPALCVRARSGRATCQQCLDVCPAAAISLKNGPVVDDACTNCGLCAAVCPTGAIQPQQPSEADLLGLARRAADLPPGRALLMACPQAAPALRERAADRLLEVPCIGAVPSETLAGLLTGARRSVVLWRPEACDTCPNRAGVDLAEKAAAATNALFPGQTAVGAPDDLGAPDPTPAATETAAPAISARDRRGFFRGAARSANGLLTNWAREKPAPPPSITAAIAENGLPLRRQVLVHALNSLPTPDDARVPMRGPVASSACTFCNVCARLCPADALRAVGEGQTVRLEWQPDRCGGCGLCVESCPTRALTTGEPTPAAQVRVGQPVVLVSGRAETCGCGARYWYVADGPAACLPCRLRQGAQGLANRIVRR